MAPARIGGKDEAGSHRDCEEDVCDSAHVASVRSDLGPHKGNWPPAIVATFEKAGMFSENGRDGRPDTSGGRTRG